MKKQCLDPILPFSKIILDFSLIYLIDFSFLSPSLSFIFLFYFFVDSGRHLPSVSAAGALQLSWLSLRKGLNSLCAEAQTSQSAGEQHPPRKPGV